MANGNSDPHGALKAALDVYVAALPDDEFTALVARTRDHPTQASIVASPTRQLTKAP